MSLLTLHVVRVLPAPLPGRLRTLVIRHQHLCAVLVRQDNVFQQDPRRIQFGLKVLLAPGPGKPGELPADSQITESQRSQNTISAVRSPGVSLRPNSCPFTPRFLLSGPAYPVGT